MWVVMMANIEHMLSCAADKPNVLYLGVYDKVWH